MPDNVSEPRIEIETLALDWLEAEDRTRAEPTNAALDAAAASLSDAYAASIVAATPEELRLAWEAARRRQATEEMGSVSWAAARRVSELLRTEYQAATVV
jgi:hypothetical protein